MKSLNKSAKTSSMAIGIWALVIIAALFAAYFVFGGHIQSSSVPGGSNSNNPASSGGYYTGSVFTANAVDAQQAGTTPTATYKVAAAPAGNPSAFTSFATVTTGTTSFSPGQILNVLVTNGTLYHNGYVAGHVVPTATADTFSVPLNANASVTETMTYAYTGLQLNNGGGANNITLGAVNGASYTITDNMYGTNLQSTQDLLCIIEVTNGANITTTSPGVTYAGNGISVDSQYGTSIPGFYTIAGAGSRVWVFDQAAIKNSAAATGTITISTIATGSLPLTTKVIKTCYTKEWFIDPVAGLATYGVADSSNSVKSLAQYKFQAVVSA